MTTLERNAMRDVLADLDPTQTRTLLSYMQACEPAPYRAAVGYVTSRTSPPRKR